MDGAANNDEFSPSRYSAQAPLSGRQQKWWDNRRATLESFEKAIMLNPNDNRICSPTD
jgi:hypothetical protein